MTDADRRGLDAMIADHDDVWRLTPGDRSVLVAVREECRRLDRWRERIREAVELIGYGNVTGGVHKLEMLLGES
jgi:hypothetical protein